MAKRPTTDSGDVATLDPMTEAVVSPGQVSVEDATDILGKIADARKDADAMKPVAYTPLKDFNAAVGGKRGGNYQLKRLKVSHVDNVDVSDTRNPKVIDEAKCRLLRVPAKMGHPFDIPNTKIKLIAPYEVVMEVGEEEYCDEKARDRVLSRQWIPQTFDAEGNDTGPAYVNLGPVDWAKVNAAGGQTWMGKAGLETAIK